MTTEQRALLRSEANTGLLVFSDDWGRHPSSCQHLISRLLRTYQTVWVNTIGMRTPSLNLATVKRGFEKIVQWTQPQKAAESLPDNLTVFAPHMWPWFTSRRDRRLNRWMLLKALRPVIESHPGPVVAVTTVPIVADIVGELPVDRWVYYCVDDFSVWPGLDQQALEAMEADLIAKVDDIFAVSETLQEKLRAAGRESVLLTHGVDLEMWQQSGTANCPTELCELERPLFVFWGVIDRRLDVAFVRRLSDDLERGTILMVGPVQDVNPELAALPWVRLFPPMPLERLPALAAEADVLLMPYLDTDVTRAMQPLKLKEYLATGKPAVVRDLPTTRPWGDCLDIAQMPAEFSLAARRRAVDGLPETHRRARERLAAESWDAKAAQFEEVLLKATACC